MESVDCEPCNARFIRREADHWCMVCEERLCNECTDIHKVQKVSKNHQLVQLDQKPQDLNLPNYCTKHELSFEYFCVDHYDLCCKECVAVSHRRCQKVQSLDVYASHAKDSQAFIDSGQQIKHILQALMSFLENRKRNIKELEKKSNAIKEEISDIKQNMIHYLDQIEKTLISELNESKETHISEIQTKVKEIEQLMSKTQEQEEKFEFIQQYGSDKQAFLMTQTAQQHLQEIENKVQILVGNSSDLSLNFIGYADTYNSFAIGSIEKTDIPNRDRFVPYTHLQSQSPVEENRKCEIFKYKYNIPAVENMIITGMTITDDNLLLLCDARNLALHIYNQNETLDRSIKLDDKPWDVATIPKTTLAVVVGSYKSSIQFVNFSSWRLEKEINVPVVSGLNGINVTKDHILVGGKGEIIFFNHSGNYVKTIQLNTQDQIWYLTATFNGTIAFTCFRNNAIYGVNNDGDTIFTYKSDDMITPRKIVYDQKSNLYVVAEDSQNIHKLTPGGEQMKTILSQEDDLANPCTICFNKTNSKLYVSNEEGERIYVFKVED